MFLRLDSRDDSNVQQVHKLTIEYTQTYIQAMSAFQRLLSANVSIDSDTEECSRKYLDFRIENDPAKNILNFAFGADWTNQALMNAVFPKEINTN
jgi:Ferredoxin-dependent bilin reductase